jgi:hypothetical protein
MNVVAADSPHNAVETYIRQAAVLRGIDPDTAVAVANSEGLRGYDPTRPDRGGDAGTSFGPFQLHYGIEGVTPKGLGDAFTAATGMSARDPSTWKQQVDFALDQAKTGGWGPFHGAANTGISQFAGINGRTPETGMLAANRQAGVEAEGRNIVPQSAAQAGWGPTGQQQQGGGGLLGNLFGGFHLSDPQRMAMMSAGMAMMGGGSLNPWINIGRGGLAGLQTYQQWAGPEAQFHSAQAQGVMTDNYIKMMRLQQLQDWANANSTHAANYATHVGNVADNPQSGITPGHVISGNVPQGTVAQGNAPPPANAPSQHVQLDPDWDPQTVSENMKRYALIPEAYNYYKDHWDQIQRTGRGLDVNGNVVLIPGYAESEGQIAGTKKAAEVTAENRGKPGVEMAGGTKYLTPEQQGLAPTGTDEATANNQQPEQQSNLREKMSVNPQTAKITSAIPSAPEGGGYYVPKLPKGAKITEDSPQNTDLRKEDQQNVASQTTAAPNMDVALTRTRSLAQAFKLFQSGAFGDKREALAAIAQSAGFNDIARRVAQGDPAAMQWVEKEAVNNVLATLKEATPRFAQSEFNKIAEVGTANVTNLPQANFAVLTEMMAVAKRNQDFLHDWATAKKQGWTSITSFNEAWRGANPIEEYEAAAAKQMGNFRGMNLPPKLTAGAIYVTPDNVPPPLQKRGLKPGDLFQYKNDDVDKIPPAQYYTRQWGE